MAKETKMNLKVDLQCCKCYKKVKKVLCKFPREIRDQVFDEKKGIVTITVVCCDPEKLRDKLCCKGEECIKSIEIVEPPKPQPPKPQSPKPPKPPSPPPPPTVVVQVCCGPCYQRCGCCGGCYGWPVCNCYCWGRPCCVRRCDCDENPLGCTVM